MLQSVAHTTEGRVNERIVRLEPVAERTPQHARRSTRRSALHHIMFSVKEVGRVAGVKGKRLKARERRKNGGGPFPTVSKGVLYTEGATAGGIAPHGYRIPALEIEVAMLNFGGRVAPGIRPFPALWSSVSCAMKLRFGREGTCRQNERKLRPPHGSHRPASRAVSGAVFEHALIKPLTLATRTKSVDGGCSVP